MIPVGFPGEHCCISWLTDVLNISFLELTPDKQDVVGQAGKETLFYHIPLMVLSEAEVTDFSICRELYRSLIY